MNNRVTFNLMFCLLSLASFYIILNIGLIYGMNEPYYPALGFDIWNHYLKSGIAAPGELRFYTLLAVAVAFTIFISNPKLFMDKKAYGDARWAKKSEIRKMKLFSKSGMILGRWHGKLLRTQDYLSVLMIAPPDSMKSVGLMIPNLLSCSDSMLIYDVKFALFNDTSKHRATFSKVIRFSPALPDSARFNPLSIDMIGEDENDIVGIVERLASIIYPHPTQGDTHWADGARTMFIFFALIEIEKNGETTIPDIRRQALSTESFIDADDDGEINAKGMQAWIMGFLDDNEDSSSEQITLRGEDLVGRPEKEFGSIRGAFTTGLAGFSDSRCERAFSGNDFTPSSLRKERTSVYLCVSDNDSKRFAVPIRILFEAFNSHFLSVKPSDDEFGVMNLIDEFPRLGKMDVVIDAPALQRSNRVRTIFACQAVSQIEEVYGKPKIQTLENSCAFNLFVPQNSPNANEEISKSCGDYTANKKSKSTSSNSTSVSESEEKRRLILAQDVGSMPRGDMILRVQGFFNRPIYGRLALFFEHPKMKNLTGSIESEIETATAGDNE